MFDLENGVFNLTNLNEMGDDDVLATNADDVMTEDTNISVPGGLSEKPKGVPSDQSISIPGKTEISADEYNKAVSLLKKSFKEAVGVLDILEHVTVIQETAEQRIEREQNNYMEEMISEAVLQSFENGPIFEAVKRSDKDEVKKIVNKVRGKIAKELSKDNIKFYKINKVLSILINAGVMGLSGAYLGNSIGTATGVAAIMGGSTVKAANAAITAGEVAGAGAGTIAGGLKTFWNTRLWQILGMVYLEGQTIDDVTKSLTERLADDLGEYKIIPVRTSKSLFGLIRTKFGWKNHKSAYMLIVDKKLSSEIKRAIKEVDDAVKEASKEANDKGKPMSESEIEEFVDEIYELTESFDGYAYMEKCGKDDLDCMKSELADRKKKLKEQQKEDDHGSDCTCRKCKHLQKSIDKLEKKIKKVEEKED